MPYAPLTSATVEPITGAVAGFASLIVTLTPAFDSTAPFTPVMATRVTLPSSTGWLYVETTGAAAGADVSFVAPPSSAGETLPAASVAVALMLSAPSARAVRSFITDQV